MARPAESADPPAVVILVSDEPLLVDRAIAALRDAAVPEALRGFNYEVLDGKGLTASRLLGAVQTLPMMAARRMVLVRELPAMAAAELGQLTGYLERPSPSTVLAATAAKIDRRLKLFALAGKLGLVRELAAPRDLAGFVRDEARRQAVAIDDGAVRRLAEVVGADLSRLALALGQLGLYAGGRPVTADDVDDLVAETRERSVFELTDAIGAGDRPRTAQALGSLLDQRQSAVGLVAMLARHVRQLGILVAAHGERLAKPELARRLGVPPFVVDKLQAQAQRTSPAQLGRATAELARVDRALKGEAASGKALGKALSERVLLEGLIDVLLTAR